MRIACCGCYGDGWRCQSMLRKMTGLKFEEWVQFSHNLSATSILCPSQTRGRGRGVRSEQRGQIGSMYQFRPELTKPEQSHKKQLPLL